MDEACKLETNFTSAELISSEMQKRFEDLYHLYSHVDERAQAIEERLQSYTPRQLSDLPLREV